MLNKQSLTQLHQTPRQLDPAIGAAYLTKHKLMTSLWWWEGAS